MSVKKPTLCAAFQSWMEISSEFGLERSMIGMSIAETVVSFCDEAIMKILSLIDDVLFM